MVVPFVKEFDDLAENIANPNPNRPISNAVAQFGRQVCDSISANPGIWTPTVLQSPLRAACQPYWDGQGYDGPTNEAPFTGGQCATNYQVNGTYVSGGNSSGGECGTTRNWRVNTSKGPISGITVSFGPGADIVLNDGGFNTPPYDLNSSASLIPREGCNVAPNGAHHVTSMKITGVVRQDGLPDNCGDPPSVVSPGPNPAPDPGPLPPGTGPQIDARGNVILVLPGAVQISPDFTVELPIGEINLGSGTGNTAPVEPLPGDDTEGDGSAAGGGDNDFGEPPEGERWVGCCVTITGTPPGAGNIPQAEPQSIYPRTIGNVRLRFSGAAGASEYDTPLVNRQKTTCVWEPVRGLKPVGVRVNLLPGYSYRFRPYSVPEEQ